DVVIGRGDACDVVLAIDGVSGKHARLYLKDGVPWIEDLRSTNGTFLNGQRVTQATILKNGDRLRFDKAEFDLVAPVQTASTVVRSSAVNDRVVTPKPLASEKPYGWADPDNLEKSKTQFMTPEQLAEALKKESVSGVQPEVDGPHLVILKGDAAG